MSATTKDIARHFNDCYVKAKAELGENFDSLMADLAAELIQLNSKAKEGTSIFSTALVLCIPADDKELAEDDYDREDEKQMFLYTKAAAVWWLLEQKKARAAI